ncbi:MAG: hypothetical protein Fur0025_48230 [Oscillatoriaceae cyanobacterium]
MILLKKRSGFALRMQYRAWLRIPYPLDSETFSESLSILTEILREGFLAHSDRPLKFPPQIKPDRQQ